MTFSDRQRRFQQLTLPWRDRLYSVALRQTHTAHIAEDWLQETLLRAWRDFGQLTETIAIYAWLLKILNHVIAEDRRREKRRHNLAPVIAVDDKDLLAHPCSAPGPFEQKVQQQTSEQILLAVQKLPEEFQRVILLRDIEGLSYNDVAYILDIPKGTVMSRLSRGRRILSSTLMKLGAVEIVSDRCRKDSGENNE